MWWRSKCTFAKQEKYFIHNPYDAKKKAKGKINVRSHNKSSVAWESLLLLAARSQAYHVKT